MSSVSRGYFYGNCKSSLHQATGSCRAKLKWKQFLVSVLHASDGCECAIVIGFIKGVYIPGFFSPFKGNELLFFYYWNQSMFSFSLRLCCVEKWIKGILILSVAVFWAPSSGELHHLHNADSLFSTRTLHRGRYTRQAHVGPMIYLPHNIVQYARLLQYLQWPCTG